MTRWRTALLPLALLGALAAGQGTEDPVLQFAVEQFFATQQSEDVEAYLALWSAGAERPGREQLEYVFRSGDDVFSGIAIVKVQPYQGRLRVRVAAQRARTDLAGRTRQSAMTVSLTYAKEGNDWKLWREAPVDDDLAVMLLETDSAEEREALLAAEPEVVTDGLIVALSRRASQAAQMQAYAAARTGFERTLEVARRVGNRRLEGEALQNLGNARYFLRDLAGALEAFEQRLIVEREREDDEGIAAALGGIATIRYSFAEYGTALTAYRDALAIQERLGDEAGMATTLLSTGNVLYLQGDFDGATAGYTRSRMLYRKSLNPAGEADALEGLGRVLIARGDYGGALEAFAGVLDEGQARNDRGAQGTAMLSIGEIHFRLGNLDTARTSFETSKAHFDAIGDASNTGRVWQAIALTDLVAGRFSLAEEEYSKSIASCAGAADRDCVAGATVGLGFAQNAQEKYREAIASYKKAVSAFAALNRREQAARAEVGLAEALSGAGEHGAAIDAAVSARRRVAVGQEADDILWRALVAEARALRRLGQRDQALGAARAAIQAVDRIVEAAANRPSSPVPRDTSAAFATLTVLHAEAGDAAAAFETAERLRVHDLRTILAPVEREIGRGMLAEERDEERAAAGELVSLHAQLSREKALPKPDPARVDRLERGVADAAARRSSQQDRLFVRLPELRIWRGMIPPATRDDDLQTLLPGADTVILEFVVDDEDVVVLSVRRGGEGPQIAAHVAAIKRRALADRVAALTAPATLRSLEDWRRASSELVKSLPAAMLPALTSARRAVVIPHEMLWRVPFEALANGDRFVADGTAVAYAGSVSTLLRTPPRPQTERPEAYLLVAAAPQVSDVVLQRIRQTAPEWSIRDESTGQRELDEIVGAVPGSGRVVSLSGEGATEAALRERLPDAAAIHVGVPFRVNGASPLFSPAVLAGTAREKTASFADVEDAVLEAREIMNMALKADVAVLSDGAAMSMRDAADDLATVQWAWRAAGVPTLVVARWLADEAASFAIVRELHRRLRAGEAASPSLQAACAAVRAESATRAPFYWAGWLTIGGR